MKLFSKIGIAVALMSSCGVLNGLSAVHNYRSGISMALSGTEGVDYAVETFYHDTPAFDTEVVYIKAATTISFSHNDLNVCGKDPTMGAFKYAPANGDVGTIRYWVDGDLNRSFSWARYENAAGVPDKSSVTPPAFTTPISFASLTYPKPAPSAGMAVLGATGNNGADILDSNAYFTYGFNDSVGDEWHTIQTWDDDSMPGVQRGQEEWWASDGKMRVFVVNPKTPCLTWAVTGTGQFYTTQAKVYFFPKINDQKTYFQAGTSGTVAVTIRDINGNNVFYRINGGAFADAGASHVTLDQDDFSNGSNTLEYYYAGNAAHTKTRTVVKNPAFPSAGETHGFLLWGTQARKDRWAKETATPSNYWWERYLWDGSTDFKHVRTTPAGTRYYNSEALIAALVTDRLGPTYKFEQYEPYSYCAKALLCNNLQRLDAFGQIGPQASGANPTREAYNRGYYDAYHVLDLVFGYDILINCFKSTQHPTGITPIEDYYIRDLIAKACLIAAWEQQSLMVGGANGGMWDIARRCAAVCGAIAMPNYDTSYYGKSGFNNTTLGGYAWAPFRDDRYTWKQLFLTNNMPMTQYPNYSARLGIEDALCLPGGVYGDRPVYFTNMSYVMTLAATTLNRFDSTKKFPNLEACLVNALNGTLTGTKGTDGQQRVIAPTGYNKSFPAAAVVGVPYLQANPGKLEAAAFNAPYLWGFYDSELPGNTLNAPTGLRAVPPPP